MARVMKDSGIEWIGEIPAGWALRKGKWILFHLERPVEPDDGVITCFRDGEVTLRSKRREEGFTFSLQEAGYQGIEPGDLVVHGMDGFAGAIGISDSRGKGTPVLNVLDSTENKRYLMYFLRTMACNGIFLALSTGIRVRSCDTNWNKLKELQFILPHGDEQEKIVDFLDRKCAEIDAVIEKTKATIEEYKKLKQAVITEAVTKGIRGNRPMKDSGIEWIGEIPEEWEMRKCKHISSFINGYAFDSADLCMDFTYPVIRIGDIKDGCVDFECCQGVKWNQGLDNYRIQVNDILLAMSGATVGKVGLAIPTCNSYINQRVGILRSDCYKYLYYVLSTDDFVEYILLEASGSAQPNVSGKVCGNYPLPYPPCSERKEIVLFLDEKCAALDILIAKKTALLTELETYKKSLIYEYVTGKKEVNEQ